MKPTYVDFDHKKFQKALSEKYDLRGEVGVLSYNFSKEICKLWRFKTPEIARVSAAALREKYDFYISEWREAICLENKIYSFIRADICRKFILMGYTRAMRYYNHKSGTKWKKSRGDNWQILAPDHDAEKKVCAEIFARVHRQIKESGEYNLALAHFKKNRFIVSFDSSKI